MTAPLTTQQHRGARLAQADSVKPDTEEARLSRINDEAARLLSEGGIEELLAETCLDGHLPRMAFYLLRACAEGRPEKIELAAYAMTMSLQRNAMRLAEATA